jgi:DNA adenine methylase
MTAKNPKTLVYFDPPYYQKGGMLYMNYFTPDDHTALSEYVHNCPYAWVLSYDDRPEIRILYKKGVNMYQRDLRYTVATPSIGKELIISNLNIPKSLTRINEVAYAG